MADNVQITAGSGTTVATDERNAFHEQLVVAGNHIKRIQVTPVISTSAYATGDCLGPLQTLTAAARFSGGHGEILAVTILDKTQAVRAAMDLFFWDRSVTTAADNALFTVSDADQLFGLGGFAVATGDYNTAWPGTPTNSIATKILATPLPFVANASDLFMQAIVRGTPTYTTTSDIVISVLIRQG